MSTPSGMAIDPSLLFNQQARAAAVAAAAAATEAAATPAQRQPEASGSMLTTAAVKQEQFDDDENDVNAVGGEADKTAQANGQGHHDAKGDASMEQDAAVDGAPAGHTVNGHLTSSNGMPVAPPSKLEDDEDAPLDLRDDVELAAFLAKLEDYDPLLPDPVTRFYLEKAGFQSSDDRVTRMLGLAAQKFVSDIARDAYAFARTRITTGPGRMPGPSTGVQAANKMRDRTRTVLTIEDLASAMHDYGIDASRAPYYR